MKNKNINKVIFAFIILIAIALIIFIIFKIFYQPKPTIQAERNLYNINYSIYVDGKIYEKGNLNIFEGEFTTTFGFNKNIDDIFVNKTQGEEFNLTLTAEEAYGNYNENLKEVVEATVKQKRIIEIPYKQNISKDKFLSIFNSEPIVNQTYETQIFPLKVISVKENNVFFIFDVKIGDKTEKDELGFWQEVVFIDKEKNILGLKINIDNKQIPQPNGYGLLNISVDEEYIYFTLIPQLNKFVEWNNKFGRVVSFNQTHIVLDNNHPLAGKDITLFIKIINITKEKGIIFDVFIMSYCPYGIQFIKGLLPVWKEFKDIANINVRFVSYVMHGQKEEEENKRMICIREEFKDKYIDYLECFSQTGNKDICLEKIGVNKNKINECIKNRAERYLQYDAELNKKYGVKGSPTVIINGKEVYISRSPSAIASVICSYFKEKPKQCNIKFSEEIPSPGFGSGIGGSVGSCG